ncbi:MAG: ATP-binding cassette domain-containing protein [Bacteroidota bacterium]|nr:ATP-binding cassette domain-containing protein [Bacteroidota bacterium]
MLTFKNVHFSYNNHKLFDGLNLEVKQGDFTFLIGKSGSGKSTLLKLIYMDILPQKGSVQFMNYSSDTIKNSEIPLLRRKIGIVFQDFRLLKDRNIYENLEYVLEVTGKSRRNFKTMISKSLQDVGLLHKKYSMPGELSGGEMQRVAIARAIINEPLLIIADEPTGNLDPETTGEIVEILKQINSRGTALLFATHNYDIIKKNKGNIYKLEHGKAQKAVFKQK